MMHSSKRLFAAREEAGLTQRKVAEKLGTFRSWIPKSETGDRRLDVMELMRLGGLYGKPLDYFLKEK
jgi:transcriptional regulator with XRE-family HTH domain